MTRNETDSEGLTPKQEKALAALLTQPTTHEAAKAAGVSRATLFRWLNDPVFAAAYREARGRLLESTLTALQSAGPAAVATLLNVMENATSNPGAQVSAAKAILDAGLKARDMLEIEERLKTVEALLTPNKKGER